MTPEQLFNLLNLVSDALDPECYIADMVINDYNVANYNIDFAIDGIDVNRRVFVNDHPGTSLHRIELVKQFLLWLRSIPEETRDAFMDVYCS